MQLGLFVVLSEQYYCKSDEPISLKLGVMIGPVKWKSWLTYGSDPVPCMDSGSLLQFTDHCRIWDFVIFISRPIFRIFISISDSQCPFFTMHSNV